MSGCMRSPLQFVNRPEADLAFALSVTKCPPFERQYRYAPGRRLRADFAWPDHRLLVEVQGGIFRGGSKGGRGAHGSITGILADIDRLNTATLAGYRLLRVTPDMVSSGAALALIEAALGIGLEVKNEQPTRFCD